MTTEPQRRRSTAEIRDLLVGVAAREFAENGYDETTTRSVALKAGVSKSVLHRHFPTKEGLFSAAMLVPFLAFFDDFSRAWSSQLENPWDDERLVGEYIRDLYSNLMKHRGTLATLVGSSGKSDGELIDELRAGVAAGLAQLREIGEHEAEVRGWFEPEVVRYTNILVISLVAGMVLVMPWLREQDQDDEALVDAATRLAVHGIRLAPR